jgi:DNA-binding NarL/FixJ family response regulator
MMRVVVVAAGGTEMARMTDLVARIDGVELVRHASGRRDVGRLFAGLRPDVALVHDSTGTALSARIQEIRASAPGTAIVVLTDSIESRWIAQTLLMGAAAIAPANGPPSTLRQILDEVLDTPALVA